MFGCLKLFRLSLSFFLSILLLIVIIVGIPVLSFFQLITVKENVKTWLDEGDVYGVIVNDVVDEIYSNIEYQPETEGLQFSEQELRTISQSVLTQDWLQSQTEGFIDALYDYLGGETDTIAFTIDIASQREGIATAFGEVIKNKLQELPTCEAGQVSEGFDPLVQAECIPAGFNIDAEIETIVGDMLSDESFIPEGEFSTTGWNYDVAMTSRIQQVYTVAQNLGLIILAVIVVISLVIFVVVPGFKNGFLYVGILWFLSSIVLLFGGFYARDNYDVFFDNLTQRINLEQADFVISLIRTPVQSIFLDVIGYASKLAIVLIVLGMIFIFGGVILKLSKRTYYVKDDKDFDEPDEPDRSIPEPEQPAPSAPAVQTPSLAASTPTAPQTATNVQEQLPTTQAGVTPAANGGYNFVDEKGATTQPPQLAPQQPDEMTEKPAEKKKTKSDGDTTEVNLR